MMHDAKSFEAFMAMASKKLIEITDEAVRKFIEQIDGQLPDEATAKEHGHLVRMANAEGDDWATFFIWRKHNVLAWRYGSPENAAAVTFCHLFPDDWPEELAEFIAKL